MTSNTNNLVKPLDKYNINTTFGTLNTICDTNDTKDLEDKKSNPINTDTQLNITIKYTYSKYK
jgi:hypothetical protein